MEKKAIRFTIRSKEDLKQNFNTNDYEEIFLIFNNDISFSCNELFEPLDFNDKTVYIDGNNHTITNLFINKPNCNEVGLISKSKDLIVKNMKIKNAKIYGNEVVGTLAGEVKNNLYLENIDIESKINANSISGGICGCTNNIDIKNSIINTNIKGRGVIGGVCGMANDYKEKNIVINSNLTPEYKKILRDTATNEKVGYLSNERTNNILKMLIESYIKTTKIINPEYSLKLQNKLGIYFTYKN